MYSWRFHDSHYPSVGKHDKMNKLEEYNHMISLILRYVCLYHPSSKIRKTGLICTKKKINKSGASWNVTQLLQTLCAFHLVNHMLMSVLFSAQRWSVLSRLAECSKLSLCFEGVFVITSSAGLPQYQSQIIIHLFRCGIIMQDLKIETVQRCHYTTPKCKVYT